MKKLRVGLTVIALALSINANAKGLLDSLVNSVIDKVSDVVRNGKQSSQAPITDNNNSNDALATTNDLMSCTYEDPFNKTNVEFECLGERINHNSDDILIKTKEPVSLVPSDKNAPYRLIRATLKYNGSFETWDISVKTDNGFEPRFNFLYATGGGAGAPELLVFHNGADTQMLTVNLKYPLGD